MLGDPDVAREVAQDAFANLNETYRPEQLQFPRATLFKVATNFALMHLRRRRLERALVLGPDGMDDAPDPAPLPDRQANADQIGQCVAGAIKALRPTLRDVFVMAHVQERPRKEIAAVLGISEKRLDKRMTKALRACREQLASYGIGMAELD